VLTQFKIFTFKNVEFIPQLDWKGKLRLVIATVALGGIAALLILQVLQEFFPDEPVTKLMEDMQENANLAAFLQADRLVEQLGIFTIPGIEDLGGLQFGNRLLRWAAGPTIMAIVDSIEGAGRFASKMMDGERSVDKQEQAERFVVKLIRSWMPGGTELVRVKRAMDEAKDPEEALRILINMTTKEQEKRHQKILRDQSRAPKPGRFGAPAFGKSSLGKPAFPKASGF